MVPAPAWPVGVRGGGRLTSASGEPGVLPLLSLWGLLSRMQGSAGYNAAGWFDGHPRCKPMFERVKAVSVCRPQQFPKSEWGRIKRHTHARNWDSTANITCYMDKNRLKSI